MKDLKYIFYTIGFTMIICTIVIAIHIQLINSDNYTDRNYYTDVMSCFFAGIMSFISIAIGIYCEHNK